MLASTDSMRSFAVRSATSVRLRAVRSRMKTKRRPPRMGQYVDVMSAGQSVPSLARCTVSNRSLPCSMMFPMCPPVTWGSSWASTSPMRMASSSSRLYPERRT